jgi:hypothetical protein
MVCKSQDADDCKAFGVVHGRWGVYHGTQYRPLWPRAQVPAGRQSTVGPSWLPSMPLRRIGTGRDSYDCPACDGFATFGLL